MIRRFVTGLLVVLLAPLLSGGALAVNQTQLLRGLGITEDLSPGKVPQGGLKVIVSLADHGTGQTLQLRTMSRLQDAVIAQLKLDEAGDLIRFRYSPVLALTASPAILGRLQQSPLVKSISLDRPLIFGLSQSGPLVGADEAQRAGADGEGVAIAVLDTGVEAGHADFGGRVVGEACFASSGSYNGNTVRSSCKDGRRSATGTGAGAPCDASGCDHGTHVASIAAGAKGVAPKAGIVAVQVFSILEGSACGGTRRCVTAFMSDVMRAMEWVYDQRGALNIAAVNLSLGGGRYKTACDGEAVARTIRLLTDAGIAVVAASGNESYSDSVALPACTTKAFTVGASDKRDGVSSFSNSDDSVDLLAPGSSIRAAIVGGGYGVKSGTSMAAPHVAGAFAALKGRFPKASLLDLESVLRDAGPSLRDNRNGLSRHRLDLASAYRIAAKKWGGEAAPKPEKQPQQGSGLLRKLPGAGGLFGGGK